MPDESLERIKKARREIEDLTAQIPAAMDVEKRRLEQDSKAYIDQQRARVEERTEELTTHAPKTVGEQIDLEFRPDGSPVPESIRRVIRKWDDGYGNIIFTGRDIFGTDEIHELSRRISGQEDAFGELSDQEKVKIQAEFESSKGKAESSKPYSDYLQSEALGRRFQELKQNPPMLFGARK